MIENSGNSGVKEWESTESRLFCDGLGLKSFIAWALALNGVMSIDKEELTL